jgi:hypothetical protein
VAYMIERMQRRSPDTSNTTLCSVSVTQTSGFSLPVMLQDSKQGQMPRGWCCRPIKYGHQLSNERKRKKLEGGMCSG